MKKILLVASCLVVLTFASCGKKNKTEADATPKSLAAATTGGVNESTTPLNRTDTLRVGGHVFEITTNRQTDKSLQTVRDEMDVLFYDNKVDVRILCDGEEMFTRTFTKKDFVDKISADDAARDVMQGMALDKDHSSAQTIVLGAQIGQPGLDGEGPAFSVSVSHDGSVVIRSVSNQVTTKTDMEGMD